jgi:hypothetical protein
MLAYRTVELGEWLRTEFSGAYKAGLCCTVPPHRGGQFQDLYAYMIVFQILARQLGVPPGSP